MLLSVEHGKEPISLLQDIVAYRTKGKVDSGPAAAADDDDDDNEEEEEEEEEEDEDDDDE